MAEASLKAGSLAKHVPSSESLGSQERHRRKLVQLWEITPGSRVLEIGCGQGDCTVVLAEAVGENGHVDAVDPGAHDYGRSTLHVVI